MKALGALLALAFVSCVPFAAQQHGAAPFERDHEFDEGSRVAIESLSRVQIENLSTLGKVWGFLKYHHPRVTAGGFHWDYELFRWLPAVLGARDRSQANAVMAARIREMGPVQPCSPCATLDHGDLQLRPDNGWSADESLLGAELSRTLHSIYRNRPAAESQFYLSRTQIRNPRFDHEPAYKGVRLPDPGYQLLALYRFWTIIQYWYPYRDVIGGDWKDVLDEFIPKVAQAKTVAVYLREMIALSARVNDTHVNIWNATHGRPPSGFCRIPATVRFLGERAVVSDLTGEQGKASGLRAGDVLTGIDGTPVAQLVKEWSPYYPASNEPTRLRDIARSLTRGACGESRLRILRGSESLEVKLRRESNTTLGLPGRTQDLPGDTFRLLSPEVAYLKLSTAVKSEVPQYMERAAGTRGLIVDIRNYPKEYLVFVLGGYLVPQPTPFVRAASCDPANPGAFYWGPPYSLTPLEPRYSGKVVILVDEVTQSRAEFTSMALRVAPGAVVIGSTTAGADGDASPFALPGDLSTLISGNGIYYPDKRPTQRIGIVPDIEVKPTVEGIRDGRDELIEKAMRHILGQ
jgi:C-terminal processing protease CtpA/Prc